MSNLNLDVRKAELGNCTTIRLRIPPIHKIHQKIEPVVEKS